MEHFCPKSCRLFKINHHKYLYLKRFVRVSHLEQKDVRLKKIINALAVKPRALWTELQLKDRLSYDQVSC